MSRLSHHPKLLMVIATALAALGTWVVAIHTTWAKQVHVWSHLDLLWLAVVLLGSAAAVPAYLVCYAALLRDGGGPRLSRRLVAQIVAVGFGPFVPGGGFSVDRKALAALNDDPDGGGLMVSEIGLLEMVVLCPPLGIAAVTLLFVHQRPGVDSGLLWWVYGVPIGLVIAFTAMFWVHRHPPASPLNGWRGALYRMPLGGLALLDMLRRPRSSVPAIAGMAAYWALDLGAFYAAALCVHTHIDPRLMAVVYGSGFLLTRRSMPLGGAGVTELFLILALNWGGMPLAHAVVAVILYRIANFLLPAVPALLAQADVAPLLEAGAGEFAHDPLYMSAEEALVEAADAEAVAGTRPAATVPTAVRAGVELAGDAGYRV